jgi:hypothetical protein
MCTRGGNIRKRRRRRRSRLSCHYAGELGLVPNITRVIERTYHEHGFIVFGDFYGDSGDVVYFDAKGSRHGGDSECAVTLASRVVDGHYLQKTLNARIFQGTEGLTPMTATAQTYESKTRGSANKPNSSKERQ